MAGLFGIKFAKMTAQQIMDLENCERRVSDCVWEQCLTEGREGFIAGVESYRSPAYGNRDMTAAWRLGWHLQEKEQQQQAKWDEADRKKAQAVTPKNKPKRKKKS